MGGLYCSCLKLRVNGAFCCHNFYFISWGGRPQTPPLHISNDTNNTSQYNCELQKRIVLVKQDIYIFISEFIFYIHVLINKKNSIILIEELI